MKAIVVGERGSNHKRLVKKTGCRLIELRRHSKGGCFIESAHEDGVRARNGCAHLLKLLRQELGSPLYDAKILFNRTGMMR